MEFMSITSLKETKRENATTEIGAQENSLEPIYPIKANYVLPELVNPVDHITQLNL